MGPKEHLCGSQFEYARTVLLVLPQSLAIGFGVAVFVCALSSGAFGQSTETNNPRPFTNTQMNMHTTATVGEIDLNSEYGTVQGRGNFSTDAIAGGVATPSTATAHGANGVAGYATSACDSHARRDCNTVGLYGQARATGNGAGVWGGNVVATDYGTSGLTRVNLTGFEIDFGSVVKTNQTDFTQGLSLETGGDGTAPPGSLYAIAHWSGGTFKPQFGYVVDRGATSLSGILLDGAGFGGNNPSQCLSFKSYDSRNAARLSSACADSIGQIDLLPGGASGGVVVTTGGGLATSASISKYGNIATVGNGVPAEYAAVDLTERSAAVRATTLYEVPSTRGGVYRISWVATVTTASTTSSTLGGSDGFQVVYTDADTGVLKTTPSAGPPSAGVNRAYSQTNQGNSTGCTASGAIIVNAKASSNIQYQFGYTSSGATPMQYNLHIRIEAL